MNKYLNYAKSEAGFSVVEMMLAVVIAGMIMGAIGSFLSIHIKSFETTLDVIDSQYEAQLALNTLGEIAMESKKLAYVHNGTTVALTSHVEITDPSILAFINRDDSITVFYYDSANERIIFKDELAGASDPYNIGTIPAPYDMKDQDIWYDFAFDIKSWKISPGVGSPAPAYESTNNIYIYLDVEEDGAEVELSNLFKFRNKQ